MKFLLSSSTLLLAFVSRSKAFSISPLKINAVTTTELSVRNNNKLEEPSSRRDMLLEGAASCFGFMALAGGPQAVHAASEEQNEQEEGLSLPRVGLNAGFVSGGYATLASTFFLSDGETAAASIQDNVNTLEEAATDLLQQTNFLEESSASTAISGLEECEMFVAATMASGVEELEESASAISGLEECGSFFTANSNMGEGTASTETFLDSSF